MFYFSKEKIVIRKYKREVLLINRKYSDIKGYNIEDLLKEYNKCKEFADRSNTLNLIAIAKRALVISNKVELYDVQLQGVLALYDGSIAEMKTGEGKTFVAIVASFLKMLEEEDVYIVTANDYLAHRDAIFAQSFFSVFNKEVAYISSDNDSKTKAILYRSDIIYTTTKSLIFDYLRDNLVFNKDSICIKSLDCVIVDEADSVLIDEARTPFVITGESKNIERDYYLFNHIANKFKKDEDFSILLKTKEISLSEKGFRVLENILLEKEIINAGDELYFPENARYIELLINALKAKHTFIENIDYIVKSNMIAIIDEKSGRISEGNQYKNGIHQAVEAKEKLEIKKEQKVMSSISLQNFFKKFKSVSGMTGTARNEKKELKSVYGLDIVEIETNREVIRNDKEDIIFFTKEKKNKSIIDNIVKEHKTGRPVLVGTNTVEYSEILSELLSEREIKHSVLNAKNHMMESDIIAIAGSVGAVTIATNMAGRGTDIILGGDEIKIIDSYISKCGFGLREALSAWGKDVEKVKSLGGLCIIGAERSESRRIDQQLIGRSGRQGDEGETQFYISLDDDIIVKYSDNSKLKKMWERLGLDDDEVESRFLSNAVFKIQKTVDGFHYDARKQMLMFDQINEDQRNIMFDFRYRILIENDISKFVIKFTSNYLDRVIREYANEDSVFDSWDLKGLEGKLNLLFNTDIEIDSWFKSNSNLSFKDITSKVKTCVSSKIGELLSLNPKSSLVLKELTLRAIDEKWSNQLSGLNDLRKNVQLRGYAQEKPLDEYKKEMLNEFSSYLLEMEESVLVYATNMDKYFPKEILEMSDNEFFNYVISKTKTTVGVGLLMNVGV